MASNESSYSISSNKRVTVNPQVNAPSTFKKQSSIKPKFRIDVVTYLFPQYEMSRTIVLLYRVTL